MKLVLFNLDGALINAKKSKPVAGAQKLLKILAKNKDIKLAFYPGGGKEGGARISAAVKNAQKVYKTKFTADDIFVVSAVYTDITAAKQLGFHNAGVTEGADALAQLQRAAAELEAKDYTDSALWLMWLRLKEDPKGVEKGSYIMPASAIEHVFFSRTGIDEQRLKMFRVKKYSDIESGKLI